MTNCIPIESDLWLRDLSSDMDDPRPELIQLMKEANPTSEQIEWFLMACITSITRHPSSCFASRTSWICLNKTVAIWCQRYANFVGSCTSAKMEIQVKTIFNSSNSQKKESSICLWRASKIPCLLVTTFAKNFLLGSAQPVASQSDQYQRQIPPYWPLYSVAGANALSANESQQPGTYGILTE